MLAFKSERRHPDQITDAQLIVGLTAFFIDPHFALADDPVYPRLRHVFKRLEQEIVQPLIDLGRTDFNKAYVSFLRGIGIQMMAAGIKCVIF